MSRKPVIIDVSRSQDEPPAPTPADVPPVPDLDAAGSPLPEGAAMQRVAGFAARRGSLFGRLVWAALASLIGMAITVAAWDFVLGLFARSPLLGWVGAALGAILLAGLIALILRELFAMARLARVDRLQAEARRAIDGGREPAARLVAGLNRLYAGRADLAWAREEVKARSPEILDADGLIDLAERQYLMPLDSQAQREIEAAARHVAAATALVPLALVDVVLALGANIRMIRRIAEIYGGRAGFLGSWRLLRAVAAHLVATGAVAVGDDMLGSVAGGGALARISRRFGEGVINGALTARVGVAAMEVCRPLPFRVADRPRVTSLVKSALTGMFSSGDKTKAPDA